MRDALTKTPMIKRLAITLCLLTGSLWGSGYVPTALAADPVPVSATAEQGLANTTLSLQDLPPGFKELPPQIAAEVSSKFEGLRQQLIEAGMKPNKFFAYVHPQSLQIVFGFTGTIENQPDRANFDAIIKQIQEPEYQQELIAQYREALKSRQGIEILEYGIIPELNNVAEASTGMTVSVSMQGQPLRLDVAAFRRSSVGAFTGIMYPKDRVPTAQLGAIARLLDNRILQASSGVSPTDTVNPQISPTTTGTTDSGVIPTTGTTDRAVSPTIDTGDSSVDRPGTEKIR